MKIAETKRKFGARSLADIMNRTWTETYVTLQESVSKHTTGIILKCVWKATILPV